MDKRKAKRIAWEIVAAMCYQEGFSPTDLTIGWGEDAGAIGNVLLEIELEIRDRLQRNEEKLALQPDTKKVSE